MRRMGGFLSSFVFLLIVCNAASAQEPQVIENSEFKVAITVPGGWEVLESAGNEKAIANFKHPDSQSQIEIVGTNLMTADVANVFFTTFDKVLIDSNFEQVRKEEKTLGTLSGTEYEYKFNHSGVTLKVIVFGFMSNETAWLVIAYIQESERDTYYKDFQWTVENMKFKG